MAKTATLVSILCNLSGRPAMINPPHRMKSTCGPIAHLTPSCTWDRRCCKHPAFPAPSVSEGRVSPDLRRSASRDRERSFSCRHPRRRV